MAKKAYIGVSGAARKIGKGYIGVNGVARKIKKGYIGVGGVARLFYTSQMGIQKYGAGPTLHTSIYGLSAAHNGTYSVFTGGYYGSSDSANVRLDAYNKSLTITKPTSPTLGAGTKYDIGSASLPSYATFLALGSYAYSSNINAVSGSLTISSVSNTSAGGGWGIAEINSNIVIAGGATRSDSYTAAVNRLDNSLTLSSITALQLARSSMSSAKTTSHVIFLGGYNSSSSLRAAYKVDAYNSSYTHTTLTELSFKVPNHEQAMTTGNKALFISNTINDQTLYTYDDSLTLSSKALSSMSLDRDHLDRTDVIATVSVDGRCLVTGGNPSKTTVALDQAYTIDDSFTKSDLPALTQNRFSHVGDIIGNYIIFAGGRYYNTAGRATRTNTSDVYQLV